MQASNSILQLVISSAVSTCYAVFWILQFCAVQDPQFPLLYIQNYSKDFIIVKSLFLHIFALTTGFDIRKLISASYGQKNNKQTLILLH